VPAVHTFYSPDSPELKIGNPVTAVLPVDGEEHVVSPAEITFHSGFAEVELTERNLSIIAHTRRTYPIEDLGPATDLAPAGTPGSATCPECGNTFKTPLALRGHLRSHKV
jgi:hypothetical protein